MRYDKGWLHDWQREDTPENRDRIMRRERDRGRIPQADGWLYKGQKTLDYEDAGLKLLTESRIRWEWS